jgi:DNA-binding NtrC family response regulator
VRFGRGAERAWNRAGDTASVEIPDPRMSARHARLIVEDGGLLLEDLGSTNGTFVNGQRVESAAIEQSAVLTLGATAFVVNPGEAIPAGASGTVDTAKLGNIPQGLRTLVPLVEEQMQRLVRIAITKLPILLLGESGSGKEVLARTIHEVSARKGPFVAINCGALSPTLVESQLFGYVRGAFSGANRDEPGLVRTSSGGTLFLDEVGELPAAAQATLLRVLQEREVLPVGANHPVPVDLRVVTATLKPIEHSAAFRPDLYARIAAYVHRLPPLRERAPDMGIMVADLLQRLAPERASLLRFSPELVTALLEHAWPLNMRELEHALSVATVIATENLLRLEHLRDSLRPSAGLDEGRRASDRAPSPPLAAPRATAAPSSAPASAETSKPLSEEDARIRPLLEAALKGSRGNISEVARAMGRTRMQIHRWLKRFGWTAESFRG